MMNTFSRVTVTLFMGSLLAVSAGVEPPLNDRILIDFDDEFQRNQLVVNEGKAEVVEVEGNRVLQLDAEPGQRVKIRLAPPSETWNLKEYVNLTLDLENLSEGEAWFRLLIKDSTTEDESWYRPNLSHNGWVKPGETRVFPALLVRHKYKTPDVRPGYMDLFPDMHGLPNAQMLVWFGADVTRISEVILSLEPQAHAQRLRIDNLRGNRRASPSILETDPDAFFPFIDIYGQYMHEEWPGKINSDAGLVAAKQAEEHDLMAHPRPACFNQYGGWAEGPTHKATGHFRTQKIDGKWWFIDPEGKLFWSLGCTGVGRQRMTVNLTKKRHFYHGLPDSEHPVFGKYYSRNGNAYHSMNIVLYRKHGPEFAQHYNAWALRRIRSWSLNTLGAWSEAAVNQPEPLQTPYTLMLSVRGTPLEPVHKLKDPFEAGFSNAVAQAVQRQAGSIDDPFCIGYFCNNEIHWGEEPLKVVHDILTECGEEVAAKQELMRFLEKNSGSADAATDEVLLGFYRHLLDTYYRKCREAIKSVAPHKLYLGSRMHDGALRKEVAEAAARYSDVVSINVYEKDLDRFNVRDPRDEPFFTADKPFLVGEFDFGAVDRGKFFTGIGFAADQRNRGENYIHFIKSGLRNPRCVGAHWFHYTDSPTGSRGFDSENANCGLVNSTDSPYPAMIEAMRAVGPMMYRYRDRGAGNERAE